MKNCVNISGRVIEDLQYSHTSYEEDFYTLKFECKRNAGTKDEVLVVISSRIVDDYPESLIDEYVVICGELRTINMLGNDNKKHLYVYIFAETLDVIKMIGTDTIDLNEVSVEGSICINKGLRNTPTGRRITDVSLAVNQGNKTNYIPIIFWGRNAQNIAKLDIGTHLTIWGRLQSRNYTKNNIEHTVYELSAQYYE